MVGIKATRDIYPEKAKKEVGAFYPIKEKA